MLFTEKVGRGEIKRKGEEETEQSVPNEKCELGLLHSLGSLSLGILLRRKEALTKGQDHGRTRWASAAGHTVCP